EAHPVTLEALDIRLHLDVTATDTGEELSGYGRMRFKRLVIRLRQTVILHPANRPLQRTGSEPALHAERHPMGKRCLVGHAPAYVFRENINTAPRRYPEVLRD